MTASKRTAPGERRVLVIGAHPDDEVLGAGGTIAKHAAAGDTVMVLIVTEGVTQQYDDESLIQTKQTEARTAADRLGVSELSFGGFPDMRLDAAPHVNVNAVIEEAVSEFEPTDVYTHSSTEVNLDHRAVFDSTVVATRPGSGVERVYAYETPSSTDWVGNGQGRFAPTTYVDITDHLETKLEAFEAYETETRSKPHPRSTAVLRARAVTRGSEGGFDAAEAFSIVKEYIG